jgi:hypothetical protein
MRFFRLPTDHLKGKPGQDLRRGLGVVAHHLPTDNRQMPPELPQELRDVVEAWDGLPDSIRSAILVMVRTTLKPS